MAEHHIKSFVVRSTRMTEHQRRAYEELAPRYCIDVPLDAVGTVNPADYFDSADHPVVVEIGFGMGDATAELAAARPQTNFLGVEVHRPGVGKLLGKIDALDLRNLRIVNDDAIPFLAKLRDACLDGVHIFFPDPWQKKRHHKRRLFRPQVVAELTRVMRQGAYLYAVTDWTSYAEAILELLNGTAELENRYDGYADPQPWRPETAFERKGVAKSHAIYELFFIRR